MLKYILIGLSFSIATIAIAQTPPTPAEIDQARNICLQHLRKPLPGMRGDGKPWEDGFENCQAINDAWAATKAARDQSHINDMTKKLGK